MEMGVYHLLGETGPTTVGQMESKILPNGKFHSDWCIQHSLKKDKRTQFTERD